MKFYELDSALQEAIHAGDKPVRLKIEIAFAGYFESVFEQDILEANFYGLKEAAGGTSARGELLLDNSCGIYTYTGVGPGTEVKVSFSVGEGLPYFTRFIFYIDDRGIQDIRGPGRERYVRIGLWDLSARLRKTDDTRDWTNRAVFTYSVVCDKTQPDTSLVHGIAKRAGLSVSDIDCATIPVTLPYVALGRDTWAELSDLATAYRCHLECAVEKPLVFAHSPYQVEPEENDEFSYTFFGDSIFYLRKRSLAEFYRNTVRLKINLPVPLEKREIWRYDEQPVLYDEYLLPHYPFKYPLDREIEAGEYEAHYSIIDISGKNRPVIFADEIDTQEQAENRLEYDGGPFSYSHYDVSSHHDKAVITVHREADGDVYNVSIHGRPIVLELNRSCYLRDLEEIKNYGTVALNVTGSYYSDFLINGRPHYEDWVARELALRKQRKNEFTVKTHRALINARVGAKVQIAMRNEELAGVTTGFSFLYKLGEPFNATFRIVEERRNEDGE